MHFLSFNFVLTNQEVKEIFFGTFSCIFQLIKLRKSLDLNHFHKSHLQFGLINVRNLLETWSRINSVVLNKITESYPFSQ